MNRDNVNIPIIRGQIADRISRADPREPEDALEFGESVGEVVLNTPAERGTVALACLILETLREHGGTAAPRRNLESVLKKTLSTMGPKAVMELEIEAY